MYTVYHARTDQKGSALELDYNPRKRQTFLTVARQTAEKEFGWPAKADEKTSENAVRIRLDMDDVARLADGLPRPQEAQKENGQLAVFNTLHDRNKGSEKEGTDTTSLKILSMASLKFSGVEKSDLSAPVRVGVLPHAACKGLEKALRAAGETELMFVWEGPSEEKTAGFVTCRFGKWRMKMRLLDGSYPDYRRIIPSLGLKVTFEPGDLYMGLTRILAAVTEDKASVRIRFGPGGMTLSPLSDEQFVQEIRCEYSGEPFEFILNAQYAAQALKFATGSVTMFAGEELAIFHFADRVAWLHLLMFMAQARQDEDIPPVFPEADAVQIDPLEALSGSGSRLRKAKPDRPMDLHRRLKELEAENRRLKDEALSLKQELEARQVSVHRGNLIPLTVSPKGFAEAEVGPNKVVFQKEKILSQESGEQIGRYDNATGLGLLRGQPVRIRHDPGNHGWVLQILGSVHEQDALYSASGSEDLIIAEAKRVMSKRFRRGREIKCPDEAREAIQIWLAPSEREIFGCLFLDNRNRVLEFKELFYGTVSSAAVYPREVAKEALRLNASGVILAHNHPSGESIPSDNDILITKRLKEALALIDVKILDHLVTGDTIFSFNEKGMV
jgi:DNA repair protein RadC